jgi:hypothetical protein
MKRKMTIAFVAIMLPLLALLVGFKTLSHDSENPVGPPPDDAVGQMVNGQPTLLMDKLVKEFPNGGDITVFNFVNLDDGLNLIRKGILPNGVHRTEAMKVSIINGWIIYQPVWFTVCDDNTCNFCSVNAAKSACNCGGGGGCNFGMAGPVGVPVVVL